MYEVRDRSNNVIERAENLSAAKMFADSMRKNTGNQFDIYEIKLVWTTETIDEALDNKINDITLYT